jgi:uncharacterized membrane protein
VSKPSSSHRTTEIRPHDVRLELWLSRLLRGGVGIALALLFIGFVVNYAKGQSWMAATDMEELLSGKLTLHSEPPRNLAQFVYGFTSLQSLNFVQGAILILILLPAFRVAFLLGSFARQREWILAGLAFLVLTFMSVGTIFRLVH